MYAITERKSRVKITNMTITNRKNNPNEKITFILLYHIIILYYKFILSLQNNLRLKNKLTTH
jgi:type II secretory pathway component PulC